MLYKVINKTVVNRLHLLMGFLTNPNYASFVMGRSITDNIIVAQEAVHSLESLQPNQVGFSRGYFGRGKASLFSSQGQYALCLFFFTSSALEWIFY